MDAPRHKVALIVDPDSIAQRAAAEILGLLGFESVRAASSAEALDRVRQIGAALVLVGPELPDMAACDLVRRLRELDAGLPVVVLGPCDTGADALGPGTAVVDRAHDLDQLRRAIETLLPGEANHHHHQLAWADNHRDCRDPALCRVLERLFRGSAAMRHLEAAVQQAATIDAPVLVEGEAGVGKELVAQAVHHFSARAPRRWMKLSAASLPPDLLESELFGREDGAAGKPGKLELAAGGTLFLDDVDEVPAGLQAKLLRLLEDRDFFRVGGRDLLTIDVRIVAATRRSLTSLVAAGAFRADLYDCLNVVRIQVPPLRDRRDEIPQLVDHFRDTFARQYRRPAGPLSGETLDLLLAYRWPGNVRELEGMIKRYVVLGDERHLRSELEARLRAVGPGGTSPAPPAPLEALEIGLREIARRAAREAERVAIREVLERVQWNRAEAARLLKISYKTLLHRLNEEGFAKKPRAGRHGPPPAGGP
jgi:two-component system response regulator AtoC